RDASVVRLHETGLRLLASAGAGGLLAVAAVTGALRAGGEQVVRRVAHLREREAPRVEHLECARALARVAQRLEVPRLELALAHRDAAADERAHHAVAERVGLHVRHEHAMLVAPPVEL